MSEKAKRLVRFNYKENANIVRAPDYSLIDRRSRDDPSGEVESLAGKLGGIKMGDRVKVAKVSKKVAPKSTVKTGIENKAILNLAGLDKISGLMYVPKSSNTRQIYEMFIEIIQKEIGYDHPQEILWGSADEILQTLKNQKTSDREKRQEVFTLLGNVDDETYSAMINLVTKLDDYYSSTKSNYQPGAENIDETYGINVKFDESESSESDDSVQGIVAESDDSEDEEREAAKKLQADNSDVKVSSDEKNMEKKSIENSLKGANKESTKVDRMEDFNFKEIDAFWLQRKISKVFKDPVICQSKTKIIMDILKEAKDAREVENSLVSELGHEMFDLIRLLRQNRFPIYYCIKLASASINDKWAIEKEIFYNKDPQVQKLMKTLEKDGKINISSLIDASKEKRELIDNNLNENDETEAYVMQDIDIFEAQKNSKNKSSSTYHTELNNIDIDELAFTEGGLLMANKKCILGQGSTRTQGKGFEEIHVPAPDVPSYEKDEKLTLISNLPKYMQGAFTGYKSLNRIQSKVCKSAIESDENLLICAPTGAGKTNVALLTIMREVGKNSSITDGSIDLTAFKIVYIAPMKSLAQEMANSFSNRLENYGMRVMECTGDHALTQHEILNTQVLICTPEKWDIISRKGDERSYSQQVSLIIFDEIHLLHDDRGPVLESIIMRIRQNSDCGYKAPRLVGLSATLPNYKDVCVFLNVNVKSGLFHFSNSYRPVPLSQTFYGLIEKKPIKRMQISNEIIYERIIADHGRNQLLVFVHSQKETARTAKAIRDMMLEKETLGMLVDDESAGILKNEVEQIKNESLREIMPYGFGIHHAGMSKIDRTLVEDMFADGHIKVLISTATLAWGVNLPAHTVIIKGTQIYNATKGRWVELGVLDIMQMLGRAGRPQYDSKGLGILITTHSQLQYYLSIMNEQLPVESQLLSRLADSLNAEISNSNIKKLEDTVKWLNYSYLYIRMIQNPRLYGVSHDEVKKDPKLEKMLASLAHSALIQLDKSGLILYDRKTSVIQPTDLCHIASQYYCHHRSIAAFMKILKIHSGQIELCRVFSQSSEFSQIIVRDEEKIELQKLVEKVPIPLKESIDEPSAKVNILLQSYISQLKLDGFALSSDMYYVSQNAPRIFMALSAIAFERKWAQASLKALEMSKCCNARMWTSMTPLRQFKNIPMDIISKLEKRNLPWEIVIEMEPNEISEILRMPKIGKNLHKYIHMIPRVDISAAIHPITHTQLKIDLKIISDFNWDDKIHGSAQMFHLFVFDQDELHILHKQSIIIKKDKLHQDLNLSIIVPLSIPQPPQYFIHCTSNKWIGSTIILPLSLHKLILPEKFIPPTELLDLQQIPVINLKNKSYEAIYKDKFTYFNSVQTQIFSQLYSGDDSILICASYRSGKVVCAQIAMLRYFSQLNEKSPAIVICPSSQHVRQLTHRLSNFSLKLNKSLNVLTGNLTYDFKLLELSDIIITTASNYNALLNKWKQRKILHSIGLHIIYGLEYLNSEYGSELEIAGSLVRYISIQTDKKTRIIGISYSLANAKDVGQWLGIAPNYVYNFHPSIKQVPTEMHVQYFEQLNPRTRFFTMIRSAYRSIVTYSGSKPCIIYVSSKKFAYLLAYNFIQIFLNSKTEKKPFLSVNESDIQKYSDVLSNKYLKEILLYGIGIIDESLSDKDHKITKSLYTSGAIDVCIITREALFDVDIHSYMTVIMDLEYYDASSDLFRSYSIKDIMLMASSASRPLVDSNSKVVILCNRAQFEFCKKYLQDPLPIESSLDLNMIRFINSEISSKTIENKQDAVDLLTWTFLYRRLSQNPNFYGLTGLTHRHISDYLSNLIENSISILESYSCIEVENDIDTYALNLGMISSYYSIAAEEISMFSKSYTEKTKLKGLLEVITNSNLFSNLLYLREGEPEFIRSLASNLPFQSSKFSGERWEHSLNCKIICLIQAHLSKIHLNNEMNTDLVSILPLFLRCIHASVDIMATQNWLTPVLTSMEFSQYIIQATWPKNAVLLQIPHFDEENILEKCKNSGIESVYDILENKNEFDDIISMFSNAKKAEIVKFCNNYPNIELDYEILNLKDHYKPDEAISVKILLQLDEESEDDNQTINYVVSKNYPMKHEQGWWLLIGLPDQNTLLAIKKLTINKTQTGVKLSFNAPTQRGEFEPFIYFISDCLVGCDQEYSFKITVE